MTIKKIATILLLIFALTGCKEQSGSNKVQVKRPVINKVLTAKVRRMRVPIFYETVGTVKANATVTIAARIMGVVTKVMCKEGEVIKAGQLLVSIDNRQFRQQRAAAAAALGEARQGLATADQHRKLAKLTYQRYKKLFDEKAISGQEIAEIKTKMQVAGLQHKMAAKAVTQAKAGLAQARIVLGFASIHAPVSGVIVKKMVEEGSMAAPGQPLLTIDKNGPFHIDVKVDENRAKLLRKNMPVGVEIPAQEKRLTGVITTIVKAVDPRSRALLVKIRIKAHDLSSGLFARIYVPNGSRQSLVVPLTAIVHRGQLTGVYEVDAQGVVTYRLIRTGRTSAAGVEVLSGLKENERVIVKGTNRAVDGGILQMEKRS
ncbi:MAG: efflux RND transporter periplasmic adaptor subunit [Deltaproteobacteria bacterium]|nr:efflux RND transporter periplasmic adaptor subunit [Deltaproteobacteria bacterium]